MHVRRELLLLVLSTLLLAQTPDDRAVFRSTTRLVEVGVVVHQKKGLKEPVTDLTADDFKIFDRGTRQKIAVFRKNGTRFAQPASGPADPDVFTNRSQTNPGEARGITIFLLDALNTQFPDQLQAKKQFVKLLSQIRPDDRIGVYVLGKELRILQEFTSDSRLLTEAVQRDPVEFTRQMDIFRDANEGEAAKSQAKVDRALITASAMEAIARQMAGIPGRKNLIWISAAFPVELKNTRLPDDSLAHVGGAMGAAPLQSPSGDASGRGGISIRLSDNRKVRTFTPEIDRITRALNAANITMYPVDARGLILVPDEPTNPSPSGFATMELVASQTGGVAFRDSNDIHGAIAKALEDAESSYTLGFYSDSTEKADSSFRTLKVEVTRPGMDVRARKGYIAEPEEKVAGPGLTARLSEALMSPLEESGIALSARMDRVNSQVVILVAGSDLEFHRNGDGWKGEITLLLAGKASDGHGGWKNTGTMERQIDLNSTSSEYKTMIEQGVSFTAPFPPQGTSQVRMVVLDRNSRRIGSLSILLGN